jgi:predicted AAA+ superfamily ATPase
MCRACGEPRYHRGIVGRGRRNYCPYALGGLAWQLGGKKAFSRIAADDANATNPGDVLRELLNEYGPCLILIDEWVAYARQLHDQSDLPAGSFETHFSFAQALTESAKLAPRTLLVISLPASDDTGSPHTLADDAEVGGERGREALVRLRNVVGRIESSWRPASAEEGFEIVRRRLFEPLSDPARFRDRDVVARAFAEFYQSQQQEFPPECRTSDYEKRIKAAYPIHPEVFDRLYTDWSTLLKFQRTRGVLRLMAAVIHTLWEKGDKNPLIMPANIAIDDHRVQFEMTRYLSDNWLPIIEKDIDGPGSLPLKIDAEVPNLGKFAAARRVARTIYLGSAPIADAAHHGMEDRRIKLGCVMPGESPAVFGDALRRLAGAATYLYQDGSNFWYSTQPTVTKLAEDRAEQLKRNPDAVQHEIEKRLRADLRVAGDFHRIHPLPRSPHDVPDDCDARLVVLGPDAPYTKNPGSPAEKAVWNFLGSKGSSPRIFQNTIVFLALDQTRLQDLDHAVRFFLAWESILSEKDLLDLSPHQVKQAETQRYSVDSAVSGRLPEAYQWLLVPTQKSASDPIEILPIRLTGVEPLAVRAGKRLRNDELLITAYAPTLLRREMDRIPLWRGDHVSVRQLAEDFCRYPYLPRLRDSSVLLQTIRSGLTLFTWEKESFAYADSFDESTGEYRGLRTGNVSQIEEGNGGFLVKPEAALRQMEREAAARSAAAAEDHAGAGAGPGGPSGTAGAGPPGSPESGQTGGPISAVPEGPKKPKRFHGNVVLDTTRVGRDAGRIAE